MTAVATKHQQPVRSTIPARLDRLRIAQMFGAFGTIFYGALMGTGSNRAGLTIGYLIGGGVMIIGGLSRSSSASTPGASRWSRSRDRSPKSVLGGDMS
jgi:hypothetical protein